MNGKFVEIDATAIAKLGIQAGIACSREVGGVTVLHGDKTGLVGNADFNQLFPFSLHNRLIPRCLF